MSTEKKRIDGNPFCIIHGLFQAVVATTFWDGKILKKKKYLKEY